MAFHRFESDKVPSEVRYYLREFQKTLKRNDATAIFKCYWEKWRLLTDKYYKMNPWPTAEAVVAAIGERANLKEFSNDQRAFVVLYKELRFRHIFERVPEARNVSIVLQSFQNYIDLFNTFLEKDRLTYSIPNLWLWEMINTFVGIFEWYQDWKSQPWNMSDQDKTLLSSNYQVWSIQSVLRYLHALVDKGGVPVKYNPPCFNDPATPVDNRIQFLGFCSIIGLLRVHVITADYTSALEVLNSVDLYKRSALTCISSCHVSAFYYMGVAYFMMRRYHDAFQCFKPIFEYYMPEITKMAQRDPPEKPDPDAFNSWHALIDKIYTYLFMLTQLDNKLWEQLDSETRERIEDKDFTYQIEQINGTGSSVHDQREAWHTLFKRGCPTYITPHPFDSNSKFEDGINKDIVEQPKVSQATVPTDAAHRQQLNIFLRNIRDRDFLRRLRGELRLYRSIPVQKLASRIQGDTLGIGGKKDFNMQLLRLKLGSRQLKRTQGVMASGEWHTDADADFCIEKNIVTVNDSKESNRRREQYFLRQIRAMQEHVASDTLQ